MEDRSIRGEDAVQCLRGPLQVGPAFPRVQACLQPDVLRRDSLEQPPESAGDEEEEGDGFGRGSGGTNGSKLRDGLVFGQAGKREWNLYVRIFEDGRGLIGHRREVKRVLRGGWIRDSFARVLSRANDTDDEGRSRVLVV